MVACLAAQPPPPQLTIRAFFASFDYSTLLRLRGDIDARVLTQSRVASAQEYPSEGGRYGAADLHLGDVILVLGVNASE
jgi:hypothetical protein